MAAARAKIERHHSPLPNYFRFSIDSIGQWLPEVVTDVGRGQQSGSDRLFLREWPRSRDLLVSTLAVLPAEFHKNRSYIYSALRE